MGRSYLFRIRWRSLFQLGMVGNQRLYASRHYTPQLLRTKSDLYSRFKWRLCGCGHTSPHNAHCHGHQYKPYSTVQDVDMDLPKRTSALYVRHGDSRNVTVVEVDLNLDAVFDDIEKLRLNVRRRHLETAIDVDNLVSNFRKFVLLKSEHKKLEEDRERISEEMKVIVKQQNKNPESDKKKKLLVAHGKAVREKLKLMQTVLWDMEADVILSGLQLPTALSLSTPDSDKLSRTSDVPSAEKPHRRHEEIKDEYITFSPLSTGAIYLHGPLARLELDLVDMASKTLLEEGFQPFSCPDMTKAVITEGCGRDLTNPEEVLTLQMKAADLEAHTARGGDHKQLDKWDVMLNLCGGAALPAFAAFLCKMNLASASLPQKWFSIGRYYKPVDDSNVEFPSLLAANQATQVSLFGVGKNVSEAEDVFQNFVQTLWDFYVSLGLHIRLVKVGAPGLLRAEAISTRIEAWLPSEQKYIKIAGVGMYNDFISRRLMSKWSDDVNDIYNGNFTHMVYGTALDIPRLLAIVIELGLEELSCAKLDI